MGESPRNWLDKPNSPAVQRREVTGRPLMRATDRSVASIMHYLSRVTGIGLFYIFMFVPIHFAALCLLQYVRWSHY